MICPQCLKDIKDVPPGQLPGGFYRGDDHYYLSERRFGMQCRNCGFVFECVAIVTGDPYHKRILTDDSTPDLFESDEETPLEMKITQVENELRQLRIERVKQLRKQRDKKIPKSHYKQLKEEKIK